MNIPVFSTSTAKKLVNLVKSGPTNSNPRLDNQSSLILLAKTTVSHPQGETHPVNILVGSTKGSEATVIATLDAYNRGSGTLASDTEVEVININNGLEILTGTSGSGSTACDCCECVSIPSGDITVDSQETTSHWQVVLSAVTIVQTYGSITYAGGTVDLYYDGAGPYWEADVSADLSAAYTSGSDATGATTMSAVVRLIKNESSYTKLKLIITGDVPEE